MSASLLSWPGETVWLRVDVGLPMAARREAARLARRIGIDEERVGSVEIAATEAATNLQRHATDGALVLRVALEGEHASLDVLATDTGPGIADLAGALRDGASSAGTLGVGLGAIARLADVFDIHTLPGRGTAVLARFHADRERPYAGGVEFGGLTRPIGGEEMCGDTWAVRYAEERATESDEDPESLPRPVLAMMCDGLGHGPQAARAGEVAQEAFRTSRANRPQQVLEDLHRAMRGTRGAAVAVVRADFARGRLEFAGVGNTTTCVVTDGRRASLLSSPGIVGAHLPRARPVSADAGPGSVLVMHSDGLNDRWAADGFPGLFARRPPVIAAQILRDAGARRDDIGVLVLKQAPPR
ncbi:ATP-binding SpoIIE family protein phosphatase [Streptomyces albidoflavus]|nr:ATP-binding SpoIIE family protein phosphatase [Streptomyces sp. KE1]KLJ03284.1 serine/threonine protein kinase [Streptomyces sp. KE1]